MCLHARERIEYWEFDKYNQENSKFGLQKHICIQQKSTSECTAAKDTIFSTLHDGASVWQTF